MTLKTLGKTTWDKIEIGEVFAWNGCWVVMCKHSEDSLIVLETTDRDQHCWMNDSVGKILKEVAYRSCMTFFDNTNYPLFKLPLATQRLWRCDE